MTTLDPALEAELAPPIVQVRSEPVTYSEHAPHSFFADLGYAGAPYLDELRAAQASARLARHAIETQSVEKRIAVPDGITFETRAEPNLTAGIGGEYVPPAWLTNKFATQARAGRTFADLLPQLPMPANALSVNIPKFTTGFLDGIQTAGGAAIASGDVSTTANASNVVTIAGTADFAAQLTDLGPFWDAAVYLELTRDYNLQLEKQLINGSGANGQLLGLTNFALATANSVSGAAVGTGLNQVNTLWGLLGQAAAAIGNARFLPPEVVLMSPRRWFWIAFSYDSSNRPIASPGNTGQTGLGVPAGGYPPYGPVGNIPVYLDGVLTPSPSSGTETVWLCRPSDMYLCETGPKFTVNVNPLSGAFGVRTVMRSYVAFLGNRYTGGLANVNSIPAPTNF